MGIKAAPSQLEVDLRPYQATRYEQLCRQFTWSIPAQFNIAEALLDRHAEVERPGLIVFSPDDDESNSYSFRELVAWTNAVANGLTELGVKRGDRVCLMLDQGLELAVSLLSIYRMGAVSVSMSTLLGAEGASYRINDSDAAAVIYEAELRDRVLKNEFKHIVVGGNPHGSEFSLHDLMTGSSLFPSVQTGSGEPAQMFYTSGTTGPPKGALHAHRWVLGHVPGWQMYFEMAPKPGDVFWTPAEWAWIGALGDLVLPAWYFGHTVVATKRKKFNPGEALLTMAKLRVTCSFIPPTAIRMIMKNFENPLSDYPLTLRAVCSGGEKVSPDMINWVKDKLNADLNQLYGQTEANLILTNNPMLMRVKLEATGLPTPGFVVDIVDETGAPLGPHKTGQIALRRPNPAIFLEYWMRPDKTSEKFIGDRLITGDLGYKDEEGYIYFVSRSDDIIKTAGYRVGPEEVEQQINKHPAVLESAVIGKPDPVRGNIIKAFVVLKPGYRPSEDIKNAIMQLVRNHLAAYAYPRELDFAGEIPKTSTGKLMRFVLRKREEQPA